MPAGPSRLIDAVYGGSSTTLPATGQVTLTVPARIQLSITPRILPWSGSITLRGQLEGGYVPSDGVALRLLVRYPGSRSKSGLLAFRTNAAGAFAITWSYHAGISVLTLPFWVASNSNESDYPFASSQSAGISVTFGKATPRHRRRHRPSKPTKKAASNAGSGSARRARQSPSVAPARPARS